MEDNKVYKELRKNIEILDADYRNDVIGVKLVVFIKDNNRKFFKKRVLTILLWELSDVPYMQKNIENIIDEYLFYHYQYKITNYSNDKVLKEWKESREYNDKK